MIKSLTPYASKFKKYPLYCLFFIAIEVICDVVQPIMMALIIDNGIANKDLDYIFFHGMIMVVLAIIAMIAGALGAYFAATAGTGVGAEIRQAEMKAIQNFSFSNVDRFSTSSLITRMTNDTNNIQMTLIAMLRLLVRAPLMLVFAIILAFQINQELSLIFLVATPFLGITLFFIVRTAFPRFFSLQRAIDRLNRVLQENFIGIRVVKSFVRGKEEKAKFAAENANYKKSALHAMKVIMFNMPTMQLTVYSCMIAVLWFGGNLVNTNVIGAGELLSFIAYISQILMSLMMLSFVFIMITRTKASVQRVVEVLETKSEINDDDVVIDIPVANGAITFKDVDFSYGGNSDDEILKQLNFSIESGHILGIIGPTGSGKSSLVQLIPRLYDIDDGEIYVGGKNIRQYKIKTLRDSVAMVLQKNTLFSGTIRENLMWGNEHATDEEIMQAAQYAQAHDFIMDFPDGYQTVLEQGGGNLSGGQKQRLCIARAILKQPKILILDDSTSAVDTETDGKIREAFFHHLPDTTVIIIAQRISSIAGADQIMVLNEGEINGLGTHEELLGTNAIYTDIYETQERGAEV
ncbi:ABC transporter ATP-binding protein [Isobaculum melis]|uniref:ATP-binding cassette, subfamily B n=1 Tax=Isobaculum melis TaxID=142588 RepID=A0A1H9QGY6_9LACT|nr:ABC transporter ATP-binding protein [Isobaculum melis]SER59465.1 ATP-binding cassette, subfamily B [Isobaculum melis]